MPHWIIWSWYRTPLLLCLRVDCLQVAKKLSGHFDPIVRAKPTSAPVSAPAVTPSAPEKAVWEETKEALFEVFVEILSLTHGKVREEG